MSSIGIYGGTFDPVHRGHINAALNFIHTLGLDTLYLIPAAIPPHKRIDAADNPETRLEMLHLACRQLPGYGDRILVSDYEIRMAGKSYTVNTLEHFYRPENEITFLCGTDMFLTLAQWYRPERIFELARIAFMRREQHDPATDARIEACTRRYREQFHASIVEISGEIIEISSSVLRSALAGKNGIDPAQYLPEPVLSYIRAHHLYGA